MDRTLDTETAPPQHQVDPPQPAAPGRQPADQTEAPRTEAQPPQPGEAQPRAGVSPQRFITAMSTLLGAVTRFRGRIREAYEPYAEAYGAYNTVLVRRAQRQEMMTQIAMQILFVGVGGAFGGLLSQFVKTQAPAHLDRALRRPAATPAAPPPPGSISRREVLGGSAPAPRAPTPAPSPSPAAQPGPSPLRDAAVSTAAGDILKDFIRSFTPRGGALPGAGEIFQPDVMRERLLRSVDYVEANGHDVTAALSAAVERNEQIEEDPLTAMQEIIARLGTPPEAPPPEFYTREFWSRNAWFREWQTRVMEAPHGQEVDRLYLHDRLFLRDIDASCPGLVTQTMQRARARLVQRRAEHDARMMGRLEQR